MSDAAKALDAEATAEAEGYIEVELVDGVTVHVLPPSEWRMSYIRHRVNGDMDAFVEAVFFEDDIDTWYEVDPKQGEVEEFVERLTEASGQPVGKSRRTSRSSKRTRRK